MGRGQKSSDFQFLTSDEGSLRAYDFQFADSSRRTFFQNIQFLETTYGPAAFFTDYFRELSYVILLGPGIEILCLTVVVVENAGKDTAVGKGAVWYGDGAVGQQGAHGDMPGSVRQSLQVGLILPFPASAEKFRLPSAAFGEPCIAQLAFIHQHLPPSLIHCLLGSCNRGLRHPCKSLIPLTMVISTDIIELVVGVVIAAYIVS